MPCLTPFYVNTKTVKNVPVPCGKCPFCLKRRTSAWSFRLLQELKRSSSAHFITLTYDTKHVPIQPSGYMSLDKRDLQLFFKRLRKAHYVRQLSGSLRYYAVGEYGSHTMRPHYHMALFNSQLELIQPAWQKGNVHYGEVNVASIGYTLKYMCKPGKIPLHKNDDRVREFGVMSKGIGDNYVTAEMLAWHHADLTGRMYCNLKDGKKIAMPRYYKEKIYSEMERKRINFFLVPEMREKIRQEYDDLVKRFGDDAVNVKVSRDKYRFDKMHRESLLGRDKI